MTRVTSLGLKILSVVSPEQVSLSPASAHLFQGCHRTMRGAPITRPPCCSGAGTPEAPGTPQRDGWTHKEGPGPRLYLPGGTRTRVSATEDTAPGPELRNTPSRGLDSELGLHRAPVGGTQGLELLPFVSPVGVGLALDAAAATKLHLQRLSKPLPCRAVTQHRGFLVPPDPTWGHMCWVWSASSPVVTRRTVPTLSLILDNENISNKGGKGEEVRKALF